jgi:hypothetical protein
MTNKTDKNSNATRSGAQSKIELLPTDTNLSRVIHNCRQLRRAIAGGCHEFRLLLMGGAYSRKHITTDRKGCFRVVNCIDDSVQKLTGRELFTQSNIGRAMRNAAFIAEGQNHE